MSLRWIELTPLSRQAKKEKDHYCDEQLERSRKEIYASYAIAHHKLNVSLSRIHGLKRRKSEFQELLFNGLRLLDVMDEIVSYKRYNPSDFNERKCTTDHLKMLESANRILSFTFSSLEQKSIDQQKKLQNETKNFINSAEIVSQTLEPSKCDKFKAVIQMFFGTLLAIVSCGLSTGLFKKGFRLFTGYQKRAVDEFKDSLLEKTEGAPSSFASPALETK